MALHRARHGEGAARGEVLTLVVQPLHFGGIGVATGLLVNDDGTVVPGIPMAEHDFHELVSLVVAQIVLQVLLPAHVVGLAVIDGCHDVPGSAPIRHEVEGGEAAGHIEGFVIRGRTGRGEAELLGHGAHGHEHDQRVHLGGADAVLDGMGMIAAVTVGHGKAIIEERHVELASLQYARDLLVELCGMGIVTRLRVSPRTRQVRAVLRLQEPDHHHLPRHASSPAEFMKVSSSGLSRGSRMPQAS